MYNLMKKILYISLLIPAMVYAAGEMILIEKNEIPAEYSSFYNDQINKMIVQTIAEKKYQALFSNAAIKNTNVDIPRIQVKITKGEGKDTSGIEILYGVDLADEKVRKSWVKEIPNRFVLVQVRLGVYEVLFGKNAAKKEREKVFKENQDYKRFIEANQNSLNDSSNSDSASKEKKKRKIIRN